jgi:hypothetical protein
MAEGKKSFVLYKDWIDPIRKLSNENAGKLIMNILLFVNGERENDDMDYETKMLYYSITEQIDLEWRKFNPKTGKYHWNYKGGITPENRVLRTSAKYFYWRNLVFERDSFTCQKCFVKGGILNAHHIKEFAKYPNLRFELSNGLTLCKKCHIEEHKK